MGRPISRLILNYDLESRRDNMKKQATTMVVGALLILAMLVPSFAQGGGHAKHHGRASAGGAYSGYYNSTAASYGYDAGISSGAIGGIGH
jgi:hypothetical protein